MYDYLLLKRNGNEYGLIYDRRFFSNSREARRDFRKGDTLIKCKIGSVYHGDNFSGWQVLSDDVIAEYNK